MGFQRRDAARWRDTTLTETPRGWNPAARQRGGIALVLVCLVGGVARGGEVNLAEKYPATLDVSAPPIGYDWVSGDTDVWALKSFTFDAGDKLRLTLGASTVVFGRSGSNVLWAWLKPRRPAAITSTVAGGTEHATAIWMRFHPARVGVLFPPETVVGPGSASEGVWARRACAWKIRGSYQAGNQPVVPPKSTVILDIDTREGTRRFFAVDTSAGTVSSEAFFADKPVPAPVPIEKDAAAKAFDEVWKAFDTEYAKFIIRPDVDFKKLRDRYRPVAVRAKTRYEVADALARMLTPLKDLHVAVYAGREYVPGYTTPRPLNASWKAIQRAIPGMTNNGKEVAWGRTADGIGYVNIYGLSSLELTDEFDRALDALGDTWALVVDLRGNGGGDETIGRSIAGRFAERAAVYGYSRYRNGPKHDDLGSFLPRAFEPRGPWRYASPVVVLCGRRTMSSAESLVFMLAQCPNVTTMGDRTAGASANPRRVDAGAGIRVVLPRWLDLGPDKKPFENTGIRPDVPVEAKPAEFTATRDPVLEAALKRLGAAKPDQRKPGKRAGSK